jgi:hypothetical protein
VDNAGKGESDEQFWVLPSCEQVEFVPFTFL